MAANDAGIPSSRRAVGKWHVITELDLMRLVAEHSQLEQTCNALLGGMQNTLLLSIKVRELLESSLAPHARSEDLWLTDRLAGVGAPPVAQSLLEAIRTGHSMMIHSGHQLADALESSIEMPWEQVTRFVDACRQAMMMETLAISYLAGPRLTPEARALLEDSMISLQTCRADA